MQRCFESRFSVCVRRCRLKLLLLGGEQQMDVFACFLEPMVFVFWSPRLRRDHRRMKEEAPVLCPFRKRLFHLALGFLELASGRQRPRQRSVCIDVPPLLEFLLRQPERLRHGISAGGQIKRVRSRVLSGPSLAKL